MKHVCIFVCFLAFIESCNNSKAIQERKDSIRTDIIADSLMNDTLPSIPADTISIATKNYS